MGVEHIKNQEDNKQYCKIIRNNDEKEQITNFFEKGKKVEDKNKKIKKTSPGRPNGAVLS
jgi:hypothetical protein